MFLFFKILIFSILLFFLQQKHYYSLVLVKEFPTNCYFELFTLMLFRLFKNIYQQLHVTISRGSNTGGGATIFLKSRNNIDFEKSIHIFVYTVEMKKETIEFSREKAALLSKNSYSK